MEAELRELLVKYGTPEVHKTLMKIMRDDYHYLRSIFEKKQPAAVANPIIVPETLSEPIQTVQLENTIVPPAIPDKDGVKHLVVQSKKKGMEEIFAASQALTSAEAPVPDSSPSQFRDPKDIKQFQIEAEAKKRLELEAQGITIESLLTRENLEKWIKEDGLTYAAVAREHIGCSAELVATTAKAFGIKSANAQKRAVFIAKKNSVKA